MWNFFFFVILFYFIFCCGQFWDKIWPDMWVLGLICDVV